MQNEQHDHHVGKPTYNIIFGVLAILTAIEVGWASVEFPELLHIGGLLTLGLAKAGLVVAYYMHLKYDTPIFTWIFLVPCVMGLAVIISFQGLAGY